MAQQIWLRLGAQRSALNINYEIVACFGANNMTPFVQSFESKLAKAMRQLNMHGTLTPYKGDLGIKKLHGRQLGSSRIRYMLFIALFRTARHPDLLTVNYKKIWYL